MVLLYLLGVQAYWVPRILNRMQNLGGLGIVRDRKKLIFVVAACLSATFAESGDGVAYMPWAEAAKRNISATPYWLVPFQREDDFKVRSLELQKTISSIKGANESPFCMAIFQEIGDEKQRAVEKMAELVCVGEFTKDGYEKIWKSYTVNLGTGRGRVNEELVGTTEDGYGVDYGKCSQRTISFLIHAARLEGLLSWAHKDGSRYPGNIGIFVYRDVFSGIEAWLNEYGVLPIEKPKKKLRKSRKQPAASEDAPQFKIPNFSFEDACQICEKPKRK